MVIIDGNGRESAIVEVEEPSGADSSARASLTVVTPAGHGYIATWDLRVLAGPPLLEADDFTPSVPRRSG